MRTRQQTHPFGSTIEAIIYPAILLVVMWMVFWADHLFPDTHFYKFGVIPKDVNTLGGILLMPLLHAKSEMGHIINNSVPTAILLGALVYYYREIALRVFVISWLFTGIGLWVFAENTSSYHIGMSGIVYALAAFLFTSGALRRYLPLQGISLFVAFVYGSMIWGIFPIEPHVSWEGHLAGMLSGLVLALVYRKRGPQAPKYRYELEKEMGIEPPDLEGMYNERVRIAEQESEERERMASEQVVIYHYIPKEKPEVKDPPLDDIDPQ